jgi:type I restriction enzyme M protein
MRKDVGVDGDAQRIGQLGWLLFFKIFSDQDAELELNDDDTYESPIPMALCWDQWADSQTAWAKMRRPETCCWSSSTTSCSRPLRTWTRRSTRDWAESGRCCCVACLEDAYNYMKSGTLLRQVVDKINDSIDLNQRQTRDVFGDIYEKILKDLQSAGNAGEFYTPGP